MAVWSVDEDGAGFKLLNTLSVRSDALEFPKTGNIRWKIYPDAGPNLIHERFNSSGTSLGISFFSDSAGNVFFNDTVFVRNDCILNDTSGVTLFGLTAKRSKIEIVTDGAANSGAFVISTTNAGVIAERMRINANGNVGINCTPNAAYKLDVVGAIHTNSYAAVDSDLYVGGVMEVGTLSVKKDYEASLVIVANNGTANNRVTKLSQDWANTFSGRFVNDDNITSINFLEVVRSGNTPTIMRLMPSGGNVGIGVSNPGYKLDVSGDCNITGNYKINGVNISTGGGMTDPTTTKGDIITRNATVVIRLPVGTNGQVLSAQSGQASGLQWVTPATDLVTSVFTRTGAVVAATGDYTAAQVTNAVSTIGSYADPSWITSLSYTKLTNVPSTFAPSAHNHAASEVTSGVFITARLGTGTGDATKYLRGDGSWQVLVTGGSQTPWLQIVNANGFGLYGVPWLDCSNVSGQQNSLSPTGFNFLRAGNNRYNLGLYNAESSGNVGSDIQWHAYNDAGSYLNQLFSYIRSTGNMQLCSYMGNVAIGNVIPTYKLHIIGDVNITGSYRVNGVALSTGTGQNQSPWLSNIDADGFDLGDLNNLRFRNAIGDRIYFYDNEYGIGLYTSELRLFASFGVVSFGNQTAAGIFNQAASINVGTGDFRANGQIYSSGTGFKFPDSTIQTTAALTKAAYQTPWTSNIDGGNFNLSNVANITCSILSANGLESVDVYTNNAYIQNKLKIGALTPASYTLDVAGDINFTGKLYHNGVEVKVDEMGNITAVNGSTAAADNMKKWFDGTGYNNPSNHIGVDWSSIQNQATAVNLDNTVIKSVGNIINPVIASSVTNSVVTSSVTNPVTVGINQDKTDYYLASGQLDGIADILPPTELPGVPTSPATLIEMIQFLYQYFRNQKTVSKATNSEVLYKEDNLAVLGTALLNDDGNVFTKGKIG